MRRIMRETAFRLARRDVALLLEEHQDELLKIFREELQRLDDALPDEELFIDIKMVPLGEAFLVAALRAVQRFLVEDFDTKPPSGR